jgi:hypothetical protein
MPDGVEAIRRLPVVNFYAGEADALRVHLAMLEYRQRIQCLWVLTATFVVRQLIDEWTLG